MFRGIKNQIRQAIVRWRQRKFFSFNNHDSLYHKVHQNHVYAKSKTVYITREKYPTGYTGKKSNKRYTFSDYPGFFLGGTLLLFQRRSSTITRIKEVPSTNGYQSFLVWTESGSSYKVEVKI